MALRLVKAIPQLLVLVTAALALPLLLDAAAQALQGTDDLRVEYTVTQTIRNDNGASSAPVTLESGVMIIAADGRQRIEKTFARGKEIEIVLPQARRRIKMDPAARTAVIGNTRVPFNGSQAAPAVPTLGPPHGLHVDAVWTDLGTKDVSGLTLTGKRQTNTFTGPGVSVPFTHTIDLWIYYMNGDRRNAILMEQYFDGPHELEERVITSVTRVRSSNAMFEIPAGYSVTNIK